MPADPQLVRFLNEQARPLAEKARSLFLAGSASQMTPLHGVAVQLLQAGGGVIDDGRAAEGVVQLTHDEVIAAIALLDETLGTIQADPRWLAVLKLCVRAPEVGG